MEGGSTVHTPMHSSPEWKGIPDAVYDNTIVGASENLSLALEALKESATSEFERLLKRGKLWIKRTFSKTERRKPSK